MYRARASRKLRSHACRGSATIDRARARGPKRATDDNGPIIGRSDPSHAQGSGAHSRGTRRAECGDSHPLSEQKCIPRAGRDVRGPTCTRGSPEATGGAAPGRPAMRRDGVRAFGRCASTRAMAAPPCNPARREATRLARGAPLPSESCAPRDSAWPRAQSRGGVRAGAPRAEPSWPSTHAACPRGQARRISVCRGRPGRYRSCRAGSAWRALEASRSSRAGEGSVCRGARRFL
jgi:hypothetical protein